MSHQDGWLSSWSSDYVAEEDAFVALGAQSKLSFSQARSLGKQYDNVMVCCSPDSRLSTECIRRFGPGSAVRLSFWNGGDIETQKGRAFVQKTIAELKPTMVWISPECGPYSPLQRTNQRNAAQKASLQDKRQHALAQYEGAASILRAAATLGCHVVLELSERCEAWQHDWCRKLHRDLSLHHGVCKGCQVNLRNSQGVLMCKGWGISSNWGPFVQHMSLSCDGRHAKARCEGKDSRSSAFYTEVFAKRVCAYLATSELWCQLALETNTALVLSDKPVEGACVEEACVNEGPLDAAAVRSPGHPPMGPREVDEDQYRGAEEAPGPEDDLKDIPADERRKIFQNLRRIHTASGHCSLDYLVRSLRRRGAPRIVLRCAAFFRCDTCQERRRPDPRHQASLCEIVPKWHTLQCDAGTWTHPDSGQKHQIMIGVDEGCRLRVGKILFQHQSRTPSTDDFISFLEEQWFPHFGRPAVIRLDPAGCFRSTRLDKYLSERQISPQHIPAEAHWQLPLAERAIASTKAVMTALVSENPEMRPAEALCRAIWAANNRDMYRGYSPLQHAYGRAPDMSGRLGENCLKDVPILTENGVSAEFGHDIQSMYVAEKKFLEEQARERLSRAQASGSRPMRNFSPGDLVFVWRKMTPKQEGARPFRTGRFVGPCRVLATETRVENGELRAGSVIWLYRAGNLIKASPEQLRPASEREEAWQDLQEPIVIPWTISQTLSKSPPNSYEDVTNEAQSMPRDLYPGNPHLSEQDFEAPRRRVSSKRRPQSDFDVDAGRRQKGLREGQGGGQGSGLLEGQGEGISSGLGALEGQGSGQGGISAGNAGDDEWNLDGLFGPDLGDPENQRVRVRSRSPVTRGRALASQRTLSRDDFLEDCGLVLPGEPRKFWESPGAAIELAVELPGANTRQGKEWLRDLGCFFSKQLRRNNVEVSERHLNEAQLAGFKQAKQKEVKNFVVAQAFKKLPEHLKPSRSQVLKMRWILTWKLDEAHEEQNGEPLKRDSSGNPLKPKARAVVLGYMDPDYVPNYEQNHKTVVSAGQC